MSNMKAQLLLDRRLVLAEDAFAELVLWQVPQPVRGSPHGYKYRLAYVVNEVCVLRYDNEAGRGDHRHYGGVESPTVFVDPEQLLADFWNDVTRWNDENRNEDRGS
jgi:hypothetical protein